ncbi:MAG TPA: nuclear transport factor 2 family protein [Pyrinomonadaceae bacterium]
MSTIDVVKRFWSLMASNNFRSVGEVLSDDFVLEWPQSNERIRGRDNFVAMNQEYPAHGRWRFTINRIVGDESEAVSDVSVTDGVQHARVISFFSISDGMIHKMVEFWPDPFPAPENRRHLVELMEDGS